MTLRRSIAADEALLMLAEGNKRFVSGERKASPSWYPGLKDGQAPFAVILGCADSRAPAEYVFDQGLGDLFVVRVAGNIVAPSLLGSIEYAVDQLGTKLVVVMGHSMCGAVRATLDALESGFKPDSTNVQSIVNFIALHITDLAASPPAGASLWDEAVRVNTIASSEEVKRRSPLLQQRMRDGSVKIAPCVFDIGSGVVTFYES